MECGGWLVVGEGGRGTASADAEKGNPGKVCDPIVSTVPYVHAGVERRSASAVAPSPARAQTPVRSADRGLRAGVGKTKG